MWAEGHDFFSGEDKGLDFCLRGAVLSLGYICLHAHCAAVIKGYFKRGESKGFWFQKAYEGHTVLVSLLEYSWVAWQVLVLGRG
jgi:hypothetical protein